MEKIPPIIKSHPKLREVILKRIEGELKLKQRAIIRDAADHGFTLEPGGLNRYLKHGFTLGSLREDQIIWLAFRYGIDVKVQIGVPVIDKKKHTLKWEIPPYNEKEALKKLKSIFPQTK